MPMSPLPTRTAAIGKGGAQVLDLPGPGHALSLLE